MLLKCSFKVRIGHYIPKNFVSGVIGIETKKKRKKKKVIGMGIKCIETICAVIKERNCNVDKNAILGFLVLFTNKPFSKFLICSLDILFWFINPQISLKCYQNLFHRFLNISFAMILWFICTGIAGKIATNTFCFDC